MRSILGFFIVASIATLSRLLWRLELSWASPPPPRLWERVRLVVLLNHTSLYEPLFCQAFPYSFIWRFIRKMSAPVADKTLNRPFVGFFWKLMVPNAVAISRKRDDTWSQFMDHVAPDSVLMFFPEGRMKRPNGLDKDGQPMSIRGGIADVLAKLDQGLVLIGHSGGLHHVQAPGELLPRPFRTIKLRFEALDIADYKRGLPADPKEFKQAVVADFQRRLEQGSPV